ncbi:MAG: polyprenyl synthetase family protein [Oscillospiraceae bacterium]|jgi:geranylgeranyl diphosphate synthase type II|nr:polyprenyl synthetase family protein [Oscillospiraceae bacterium]
MSNVAARLAAYAKTFEAVYPAYLPQGNTPVFAAMRYSMEAGGKRLRPALAYAFCEQFGGALQAAAPYAAALEFVHTYSLIHDDLPCMDNDDYRRGRPSCHKQFGEAVAVLAGDALLTQAFAALAHRPDMVALLAHAAGAEGMVGGQMLDLLYETSPASRAQLEEMNRKKTGALLKTACLFGCEAAGAGLAETAAAERYGDAIGLLFQVTDDILDVNGSQAKLGKTIGKDQSSGKSTWVSLLGLEGAAAYAGELAALARAAIAPHAGPGAFLHDLPGWIQTRER